MIMIENVELVDIPALLIARNATASTNSTAEDSITTTSLGRNYTGGEPKEVPVGNTANIRNLEFKHIKLTQSKGLRYFVVSDNDNHLTAIGRSLRLRGRFSADS